MTVALLLLFASLEERVFYPSFCSKRTDKSPQKLRPLLLHQSSSSRQASTHAVVSRDRGKERLSPATRVQASARGLLWGRRATLASSLTHAPAAADDCRSVAAATTTTTTAGDRVSVGVKLLQPTIVESRCSEADPEKEWKKVEGNRKEREIQTTFPSQSLVQRRSSRGDRVSRASARIAFP